ncbi:MAG: isopenicillin N synthase family dioxygenase [Rhizobiaceae bacterium]
MAYAEAGVLDSNTIPVIDITALRDNSDPVVVARQLHEASQGLGFIYVSGHGIPDHCIANTRRLAFDFFRSAPEEKETVRVSSNHRGWLAAGGAKMGDDQKADLKESFIWGLQNDSSDTIPDHSLRGQNQWPQFLPQLESAGMAYFGYAHEVAHHLMRGFAIGLGLDELFFLRTASRPLSRGSFVYYPAQPADMGADQFGVGPHTDFGVLTVLCQDTVGGLQVEDVNGDWIHAPPIEGTLIINVADLLARWTDGAYKSTPHRVVNSSGKERLSMVLAFDPDPETVIDARDIFGRHHVAKEEATTCGNYLDWRFKKAFEHRKD